jgi:hypothetical protein
MGLYAEVRRLRVLSSESGIEHADDILKKIIKPSKTIPELRETAESGLIDPLRDFREACSVFGPPA